MTCVTARRRRSQNDIGPVVSWHAGGGLLAKRGSLRPAGVVCYATAATARGRRRGGQATRFECKDDGGPFGREALGVRHHKNALPPQRLRQGRSNDAG